MRRRAVLVPSVAVAVVLGVALAGLAAWTGVLHLPYPSRQEFPIQGIDVSNHQGAVDWPRVRAEGFRFAYIKASEGKTFTDPDYASFAAGARRAGLTVGAYHYFTFCSEGEAQARRFIAASGGRVAGDLPPVVDLEFGGNCSHRPDVAEFDRQYAAFEAVVVAAFGRPPLLYVTSDFADRYLTGASARGSRVAGRRLWIRQTLGRPDGGCERWSLWQFADRGRVDGIAGPVDLDAYCGGEEGFAELTR